MSSSQTTFIREVTHLRGTACILEPGYTSTTRGPEVTCASCRSQMPSRLHGCGHSRIFPMAREHDHLGNPRSAYRWNCICGYRTMRSLENVPAEWLEIGDNRERLAEIDRRIAAVTR